MNVLLIFFRFHIDEINNHESAHVSQAQLSGGFFCLLSLLVGSIPLVFLRLYVDRYLHQSQRGLRFHQK